MSLISNRSKLELEQTRAQWRLPPGNAITRGAAPDEISRLYAAIDLVTERTNPQTSTLLALGSRTLAQMFVDQARRLAFQAMHRSETNGQCQSAAIKASADLVYHLVTVWHHEHIAPRDVWAEMRLRAELYGLAEKPPRAHRQLPRRLEPSRF